MHVALGALQVSLFLGMCGCAQTSGLPVAGEAGRSIGFHIRRAVDYDGDGLVEYLVSSQILRADKWRAAGVVSVHSGRDGECLLRMREPFGPGSFGRAAVVVGRYDRDDVPDVAVGAVHSGPLGAGRVEVRSGASGKVLGDIEGDPSVDDGFGVALVALAVSGRDELSDLLVGAHGDVIEGRSRTGSVRRYSLPDWSIVYTIRGGWGFGMKLVAIEDMDDDGVAEFATAGGWEMSKDGVRIGILQVYSGAKGSLRWQVREKRLGEVGTALSAIGDVTGDGVEDLLVGMSMSGRSGLAGIYSGADGQLVRTLFGRDMWHERFGRAVARLGDVDGDGVSDCAVSCPTRFRGRREGLEMGEWLPYVCVFSGRDGTLLRTIEAESTRSRFGASMALIGDVDGNGVEDLAIGEPGRGFPDGENGRVVVVEL